MGQAIRKIALLPAVIALALPLLAASPAQAQATRTWVSGTGDNTKNCSRTTPCQTFSGALAKTAPGGEINCLDPGDFGTVNITFSVTISCEAGTAGILVTEGAAGITINAATTDVVTLRGLDIDGQGSGVAGIQILSAKAVHIEKTAIRNFRSGSTAATGITTTPLGSVTIFLFIADTVISDNDYGIRLRSGGGFKVASLKNVAITGSTQDGLELAGGNNIYANVTGSIILGNGDRAVVVDSGSTANIERSMLANNGVALVTDGIIRISGNNIYNNTAAIAIGPGGKLQSDGTNKHGNSNGGAQVPNASFAEY